LKPSIGLTCRRTRRASRTASTQPNTFRARGYRRKDPSSPPSSTTKPKAPALCIPTIFVAYHTSGRWTARRRCWGESLAVLERSRRSASCSTRDVAHLLSTTLGVRNGLPSSIRRSPAPARPRDDRPHPLRHARRRGGGARGYWLVPEAVPRRWVGNRGDACSAPSISGFPQRD
jgi:hypothetical protein